MILFIASIPLNLKSRIPHIQLGLLHTLTYTSKGLSWPWSYGSWIYNYICNQRLSPLMLWVRISIRARCTTLCDQVCQWLVTGRWFSPETNHYKCTSKLTASAGYEQNYMTKEMITIFLLWTFIFSIYTCSNIPAAIEPSWQQFLRY